MVVNYLLARYTHRFMNRLLDFSAYSGSPMVEPATTKMLYIHIPFCRELCPYCTFNRVPLQTDLSQEYFSQLRNELCSYAEQGYAFNTVYIGGGTPTVLPAELRTLLDTIRKLWRIDELSIETTPADLEGDMVEMLRGKGVKRLSIGVQSFQDDILTSLNRREKYGAGAEIIRRLEKLKGLFDTVNIDLIFGFAGQTLAHIEQDLNIAKSINMDQITYYPLMAPVERVPSYCKWKAMAAKEMAMYQHIRDFLRPEYDQSSAWSFSRKTSMIDEYIISHTHYAGAGAGAFGFIGDSMVANVFSVENYVELLSKGKSPVLFQKTFTPGERLKYLVLLQLFSGRLSAREIRARVPFITYLLYQALLVTLIASGTAKKSGPDFLVGEKGSYRALLLMKHFFQGISRLREACRTITK